MPNNFFGSDAQWQAAKDYFATNDNSIIYKPLDYNNLAETYEEFKKLLDDSSYTSLTLQNLNLGNLSEVRESIILQAKKIPSRPIMMKWNNLPEEEQKNILMTI